MNIKDSLGQNFFVLFPELGIEFFSIHMEKSLKVVAISHCLGYEKQSPNNPYPMIRVELHKRKG